jgi:hypothetical protein
MSGSHKTYLLGTLGRRPAATGRMREWFFVGFFLSLGRIFKNGNANLEIRDASDS